MHAAAEGHLLVRGAERGVPFWLLDYNCFLHPSSQTFQISDTNDIIQVNEVAIAQTQREKVEVGSADSWTCALTIPFGITPSELPGCKIIAVAYELAVSIRKAELLDGRAGLG